MKEHDRCFNYLRLSLNVDQGRILTRCPIIDILCSVGCRLKMMTSSSLMCRSTWNNKQANVTTDSQGQKNYNPQDSTIRYRTAYLVPKLKMKVTRFGVKSQVNSLSIIPNDVFRSWVLVVSSSY